MKGKLVVGLIVAVALAAGAALYWLQIYYYYEEVPAASADIRLTPKGAEQPEPVGFADYQGIDANSSPLRYRACFTLQADPATLAEAYEAYDDPVPLTGPGWFDCYDAEAIGEALRSGRAHAFLGQHNIDYGVDRVVAVYDDGRAFVWHQLNNCGEKDYAGNPLGEDCPPRED